MCCSRSSRRPPPFLRGDPAGQFVAGWLTEYSLSVDNLFVLIIIMGRFAVPRSLQQSLLLAGIVLALLLRGVFILLGVTLIDHFSWVFYLFGAFLLYTAVQQLLSSHGKTEDEESRAIRLLRRHIPITPHYDGTALTVRLDGRRDADPGSRGLSRDRRDRPAVRPRLDPGDLRHHPGRIPGLRRERLRPDGASPAVLPARRPDHRLAYLRYGIAAILVFIGVKLVLHALHENRLVFVNGGRPVEWAPEIGTLASLAVIVLALVAAVGASLVKLRRRCRTGAARPILTPEAGGRRRLVVFFRCGPA